MSDTLDPLREAIPMNTPRITVDLVFTEDTSKLPPHYVFVEAENAAGKSISIGEWVKREDGYSVLRIDLAKEYGRLLAAERLGG